ncbi:DNA topoisomerase [Enterococcus faecium]|uniref:type IA DNA topoisomerase n=1 Tax=Enterococcus faecium TaxID=1352 RepID=UPI000B761FEA|nr:type IA DNA topoisomerase [Enterococcus faecium]MDQ8268915.1 DNA topoisomerase [Enterococcus faecium]MDV7693017.1 DNA topoisomerase [Enterococcus faecium]MDV7721614.1 DNA topoisomerase [Enterococcus faecium]MDV7727578.1 DNA topoisomerase [Enterococcus faecium]MDW3702570.1 DNA topoisomerase [Enterococcus faecium]
MIATDSDREGEAIARLIINLSGNSRKTIKRLWINSLETSEIKKGFQNLKDGQAFYSTYKEAETRQIADWLVGINLTRLYPLYMQKNGMRGVFSVGRVQTPTLFLIYQRNEEIKHFVSKPFYELYATFTHSNGKYKGKYKKRFDTLENLDGFKETNQLEQAENAEVTNVKVEEKRQYAPKLFSLSDLQSFANKRFKYSADKTLSIAQKLYEKKVLSYPRSDTNYIGSPEFDYLKSNLNRYLELAGVDISEPQLNENKRYVDGSKVQEHYAIIPTKTLPQLSDLTKDEKNIYLLVLYRTLAIFEKPYIYDETTIDTAINQVLFQSKGKTEKERGWKRLYKQEEKDKDDPFLPEVTVHDSVAFSLETKEGKTQLPNYYTEGTLLTAMKHVGRAMDDKDSKDILKETEGIGTEATRASIIETLKKQDYITISKSKIYVTEKGELLCRIIAEDEIANAGMTAQWERYLKKIRSQQGTQEAFLGSIERFVQHLIEKVPQNFQEKKENIADVASHMKQEKVIGTCPKCQNSVVDKGKFYGCSGYKDGCKFTLPKRWSQKALTKKNVQDLLSKRETSLIKGFKSKKGSNFSAKLTLNDEMKLAFEFPKK